MGTIIAQNFPESSGPLVAASRQDAMFAQALRKWSSLLMYLYQFYLILFSFWWTGAYAMHLTPSFNTYRSELARSASESPPKFAAAAAATVAAQLASTSSTPLSSSSHNSLSNDNDNKSSSSINNMTTTDFVDQIVASQKLEEVIAVRRWQQRMFEKRSRIREHRRQLERSRRDSGGRKFRSHHQPANQPHLQKKRFCSARDPATLAFEAPTVFEGKVKSMSSDRRNNFSVTFEVINKTKHHNGWELPKNVRLQFAYRNNTECDIYREEFRERGFLKKPLELGKLYFLFVKQVDLGNFTILGVPLKKNNHTIRGVLKGVSDNYGE